jgi:hypothetical protein
MSGATIVEPDALAKITICVAFIFLMRPDDFPQAASGALVALMGVPDWQPHTPITCGRSRHRGVTTSD